VSRKSTGCKEELWQDNRFRPAMQFNFSFLLVIVKTLISLEKKLFLCLKPLYDAP
jgi:hypothetical protein